MRALPAQAVALGKHARKQRPDTHAADEEMASYQAPRIPFTLIAASRRQGLKRWASYQKKARPSRFKITCGRL